MSCLVFFVYTAFLILGEPWRTMYMVFGLAWVANYLTDALQTDLSVLQTSVLQTKPSEERKKLEVQKIRFSQCQDQCCNMGLLYWKNASKLGKYQF